MASEISPDQQLVDPEQKKMTNRTALVLRFPGQVPFPDYSQMVQAEKKNQEKLRHILEIRRSRDSEGKCG